MLKKIIVFVLALVSACTCSLAIGCGGPSVSEKAQAVIDQINALPTEITGYSAGHIELAEKAYDALSAQDKEQVSNYSALQAARSEYDSKYVSILSMADLELIEDYSYWYVNGSDPYFSLIDDPEGKYGKILKIT